MTLEKTKKIVEFDHDNSASIKSFALKKQNKIKSTTRFMFGKLLTFAKLSLKRFFYELTCTFCFPKGNIEEIYKKYAIEKLEIFHVLTDTDSTSIKSIFISDPDSETPEDKFRNIIFEVIIASDIYKRFDSLHPFWDLFDARKENKRKQTRLRRN